MSVDEVQVVRDALKSMEASLPEGVDVFEVIHDFLIVGVYPDLGRPFWALFYLNLAVLSLSILLVITALGLKARQNRLYFIVYDGSCTRVDLKLAVPVLWSCGAILEIVFATSFKRAYDGQRMTRLMGTIWYLCYIPPAISFTLLSASLAAGTPPLRRYLNRVSYGALRFNAAVAFLVVATLASLIPPAFKHGIPLAAIGTAFTTVIKGIQAAKATQDREALFSLADEIVAIEMRDADYRIASRIVNGLYAAYLLAYLVIGLVSFFILRQTVYRKIARLENGAHNGTSTHALSSSSNMRDAAGNTTLNVQLKKLPAAYAGSIVHIPAQSTDRPFAQLIGRGTTMLPRRFHVILQAKEQSTTKRASQLRSTLSHDLKLLLAYLCIVISPLAMSIFMSLGGQELLDTKESWKLSYTWSVWNLAVPAFIAAVLLFRDAICPPPDEEESYTNHATPKRKKSGAFPAADVNAIHCEQIVNVAYAEAQEYPESPKTEKGVHNDREI